MFSSKQDQEKQPEARRGGKDDAKLLRMTSDVPIPGTKRRMENQVENLV